MAESLSLSLSLLSHALLLLSLSRALLLLSLSLSLMRCSFSLAKDGKPTVRGLERFRRQVLADLWEAINKEFPEKEIKSTESLTTEGEVEAAAWFALAEERLTQLAAIEAHARK